MMVPVVILACGCERSPVGVAVINVEEIFKEYEKSKDVHQQMEQEKDDLEKKGQEMLDEINTLVKESEILSDEAKKEREARIREKSIALESYRQGAMRNMMDKTNDEYQKLMTDVRAVAESIAAKSGVKVILDSSAVAYNTESLDLTGEMIKELNRRFKNQQKKEAAGG
jgi:Skp family chaperone for outer membrane proteins